MYKTWYGKFGVLLLGLYFAVGDMLFLEGRFYDNEMESWTRGLHPGEFWFTIVGAFVCSIGFLISIFYLPRNKLVAVAMFLSLACGVGLNIYDEYVSIQLGFKYLWNPKLDFDTIFSYSTAIFPIIMYSFHFSKVFGNLRSNFT